MHKRTGIGASGHAQCTSPVHTHSHRAHTTENLMGRTARRHTHIRGWLDWQQSHRAMRTLRSIEYSGDTSPLGCATLYLHHVPRGPWNLHAQCLQAMWTMRTAVNKHGKFVIERMALSAWRKKSRITFAAGAYIATCKTMANRNSAPQPGRYS